MITDSFDNKTPAIITLTRKPDAPKLDAVILTFSPMIESYIVSHYPCEQIGTLYAASGNSPVYGMDYKGKRIGFYRTCVGAPITVGFIEDVLALADVSRIILFGGSGCLDKDIARGKIMVPTAAYRDEGTSYHYAPAADFITIKNSDKVAAFMEQAGFPYVLGKTWTTDAFYRETRGNFAARKAEGCIAVEMEVAAVQAVCDFRGVELYNFLKSGDLLDAPEWDARSEQGAKGSQHDARYFEIALDLAFFVCE